MPEIVPQKDQNLSAGPAVAGGTTYLQLTLILLGLLVGNLLVRGGLERWPHQPYLQLSQETIEELKAQPWKVFLPVCTGGGQCWFASTSLLLLDLFQQLLTPLGAFLFLNALTIIVSFWTSWFACRSLVFTCSFTLCMAFGTQLHYSYVLSGTDVINLQIIYLEINLLCLYKLLFETTHQGRWRAGFVISLVLLAFGFDTWYNYFLYLWLAGAFLFCYSWRHQEPERYSRLGFVLACATLIACIHLPIKLCYSSQHFTGGKEDELILGYQSPALFIEDFFSNLMTYTYISLMNYAPPFLLASNSSFHLGASGILQEQHGYHSDMSQLVVMHHLFLWYYYAGIVFAVFLFCLVRSLIHALRFGSRESLCLSLILLGVATGSATHLLIKYRPYMSVPSLSYKCMPSILATTILLAHLLDRLQARIQRRWLAVGCVCLAWCVVLYGGLTRPRFLSHLNTQVGLGTYPDPLKKIFRSSGNRI